MIEAKKATCGPLQRSGKWDGRDKSCTALFRSE